MSSTIKNIHAVLVRPMKGKELLSSPTCSAVQLTGRLYELLSEVFEKAESECDLDIAFNPAEDGSQTNACREMIIQYIEDPSDARGQLLASRLEKNTTGQSGLGLLFIINGQTESRDFQSKIVITRFPADQAILAEDTGGTLSVQYLEKVFLRNAQSYKAVLYKGLGKNSSVWQGLAVDKQINDDLTRSSRYWISGFLMSDFLTTSASGTRRFATVLQTVGKQTNSVDVQQEIIAASKLAPSLDGQNLNSGQLLDKMNLSEKAKEVLKPELEKSNFITRSFRFDAAAFSNQVKYRWMRLENGAVLIGPADKFDDIYDIKPEEGTQEVAVSTSGKLAEIKLRAVR